MTRQPTDPVAPEEVLYRNVRSDRRRYTFSPDGELRFSSEAFLDIDKEPSVDRADLCEDGPTHTQIDASDGVTSLLAQEVSEITDVGKSDKRGNLSRRYKVDIKPDPIKDDPKLPDNLAHARIYTTPKCQTEGEFTKLKRSLARLANKRGWVINPMELRPLSNESTVDSGTATDDRQATGKTPTQ